MQDTTDSGEVDRIIKALSDRNLTAVAAGSSLHPNTVWQVASGKITPSARTIKKLAAYLFGEK